MAKITATIDEVVAILKANDRMPEKVSEIAVTEAGNGVNLKVKTGMIFPASLSVQIDYVGFEDGQMKLKLVIGGMLAKLDGMITQTIESMTLPEGLSEKLQNKQQQTAAAAIA